MELYYKDLISEEGSLDKLVDDLMRVVQGVDEFVEANGTGMEAHQLKEIASKLGWLKHRCRNLQQRVREKALAADHVLHEYPYSAAGFALALGLVAGVLCGRRRR